MKILFMEGFDTHQATNASNLGQSDSSYFYYIPLQQAQYTDGYLKGRALRWQMKPYFGQLGTAGSGTNKIPSDTTKARVCVWMKKSSTGTGDAEYDGFLYFQFGSNASNCVGIYQRPSASGSLHAGYGSPFGVSSAQSSVPTILGSASLLSFTDTWTFYELMLDRSTKKFEFYISGILQSTWTIPDTVDLSGAITMGIGGPDGGWSMDVDHLIVTDGDRPAPDVPVHAFDIVAAFDQYDSSRTGYLKGNMVISGVSYQTSLEFTNKHSKDSTFASPDYNTTTVFNFVYPVNPVDQSTWTAFSQIDAWGVCTGNLGSDPTAEGYSRLNALSLAYVETVSDDSGFPIINYRLPSTLTYYSGHWVKTDEQKTLNAHINTLPRPGGLYSDNDYLTINTDGCILFPAVTNDQDFLEIGLTFAQEYRTDYQDWDSVLGTGLSFDSYFITGYSVLGEGNKEFQSNYVTVNYENVAVGQAYLQGLWDYAMDGDTGRWSSKQQIYRFPGNYKHQMRKLKVRGGGKALQIKISSEENKDFKINGWSIFATGDTAV